MSSRSGLESFRCAFGTFWDVLGRFEVFGREIPHEKEENGSEGLKMGKNVISCVADACANLENITIQ